MAKRGRRNNLNVKIYYPLLLLCYLEVLFWTTTVLSSGGVAARPEDVCYLARETQSLKQADVASNSGGSGGPLHNFNNNPPSSSSYSTSSRSSLPGAVDWRGGAGSAHGGAAGERAAARAALVSLAKAAEERYQPLDWALRPVLSLAFLPLLKGVPAPFTGVSALSD